jgi:hypothetical protein
MFSSVDKSLNQSILSQSALISESSHHSIRSYGSLLPVLVIEAISSEGFNHFLQLIRLKISPE